ncbi:MAG: hypothetical protein HY296_06480 [Thaumarchaeota archaeon]|nr:hypothetical protein [Nitrososphaerota archaeon]
MKVSLGTFKDNGEELVTFLEPRLGTKPSLSGDSVEIEDDSVRKGVKPRHVKTYIKRFLYMKGARKNYRVFVAGKELRIQEIEVGEEKEEETKEALKQEPEATREEKAAAETKEEEPAKEAKPKKAAKKPRAKKKAAEDA